MMPARTRNTGLAFAPTAVTGDPEKASAIVLLGLLPGARQANVRSAARRNLQHLGKLLRSHRLGDELEADRLRHDGVEPDDLVGIKRRLRKEFITGARRPLLRDADELGVKLERRRVAIHPVERLPICLHVAIEDGLATLERLYVGDQEAHG